MQQDEKHVTSIDQLPWLDALWTRMVHKVEQGQFPHALLFSGIGGIGKFAFAKQLAAYLLCPERTDTQPCGQCKQCQLWLSGHHPDCQLIVPDPKTRSIKVDAIRALNEWAIQSAYAHNGYKVAILQDAEAMTMSASNSLLKTLEEPVGKVIFLLVSSSPIQLPATIRSRCQLVKFSNAKMALSQDWLSKQIAPELNAAFLLHLAHGAPLKALDLADPAKLKAREELLAGLVDLLLKNEDPVMLAKHWHQSELTWVLQNLYALLMDLIKTTLGGQSKDLYHYDFADRLLGLSNRVRQSQLLMIQDKVQEAYQITQERMNVNKQLLLEDLFIDIHQRVSQSEAL